METVIKVKNFNAKYQPLEQCKFDLPHACKMYDLGEPHKDAPDDVKQILSTMAEIKEEIKNELPKMHFYSSLFCAHHTFKNRDNTTICDKIKKSELLDIINFVDKPENAWASQLQKITYEFKFKTLATHTETTEIKQDIDVQYFALHYPLSWFIQLQKYTMPYYELYSIIQDTIINYEGRLILNALLKGAGNQKSLYQIADTSNLNALLGANALNSTSLRDLKEGYTDAQKVKNFWLELSKYEYCVNNCFLRTKVVLSPASYDGLERVIIEDKYSKKNGIHYAQEIYGFKIDVFNGYARDNQYFKQEIDDSASHDTLILLKPEHIEMQRIIEPQFILIQDLQFNAYQITCYAQHSEVFERQNGMVSRFNI